MGAYHPSAKARRDETLADVEALFPRLKERRGQPAGTLSGGEQQMVAIGRGLMARPALLMIDEPFLGLAPKVIEQISSVITAINRERGITVIFIEQNVELALKMAHRGRSPGLVRAEAHLPRPLPLCPRLGALPLSPSGRNNPTVRAS